MRERCIFAARHWRVYAFFQVRPYTGVRLELGASQTQHASAKRTSAQQPRAASSLRDEIHTEIEHTLS